MNPEPFIKVKQFDTPLFTIIYKITLIPMGIKNNLVDLCVILEKITIKKEVRDDIM